MYYKALTPVLGIFFSKNPRKKPSALLSILTLALLGAPLLTGCDLAHNYLKPDRSANMEMQDYRDALAERTPETDTSEQASDTASIPGLQPYISGPSANLEPMPLVSITVNQSVPLRDVLYELAQQADYDLELDPRITGSVIFTAREKPLDVVVDRIADMAGLRYEFGDNSLRVELDTPYNKLYKVDYLSYIRTNSGSVRNNIAVVSGDGADTGSSFEATTSSEANFWGELETGLTQILGTQSADLRTSRDPRVSVAETNPAPSVEPVVPDGDGNVEVQPPEAVLNVESIPEDTSEDMSSGGEESAEPAAGFSLNRQAGVINVYANARQHKEVKEYFDLLRRATTAQVLIEAKVLEVALNDQYNAGIDWRVLNLGAGDIALNFLSEGFGALDTINAGNGGTVAPSLGTDIIGTDSSFVVGYAGTDIQALVKAIQGFGTVHALASPRLTVLNNQSAVLNVANNRVFFEIDLDVTTEEGVTTTEISSEIRNVPEGVLVNVQPSIDLESKTISLAVRPTITRVVREIPDPAIGYIAAANDIDVESLIPELNVQEIDSVIQVRSGQPIVMGGLLQDRTEGTQASVPVLGEIPMVGALFRQTANSVNKTELVIFLKATILEAPNDSVDDTDKDLYRMFSGDRRPLKL